MKIAVNSICKNEIKFLDTWYESLKDEVDYITVLDTGSTDGTWEKLQKLSEKDSKIIIKQQKINLWRFDVARNEAMELLPKDADIWISIDLDETFEKGFAEVLRQHWKSNYTLQALYRYTWNHHEDGSPNHEFTYSKIISNDGKWKWEHPLHECLSRTEETIYENGQVLNLVDKIHLHHWQDTSVDRSYYLDLLRIRYEESQAGIDALYLARELTFHKKYEEAIDIFTRVTDKETDLKVMERAYCNYMTGCCYYFLNNRLQAHNYMLKAIHIEPTYRDPYIDLSRIYIEDQKYDEAIFWLKKCLKDTYRHLDWTEVNDVWTYVPYDLLSVAAFNSGNKKDALLYGSRAVALNPSQKLLANLKTINDSLKDKDLV